MADRPPSPESRLHYPFGDTLPAPGCTLDVAPGVRWLRMALPFALDHINLWLLRDRQDGIDGWTAIDCGIGDAPTQQLWERVFANALQGLPLLRVIVTHMHPDHIGLAHWLTERWSVPGRDCRLWISGTDFAAARLALLFHTGYSGAEAADFLALHGLVDADWQAQVRSRPNEFAALVPRLPTRYRRLLDGMAVDIGGNSWRCIAGHGHAPEHIALHCPALGVLVAGDMVLPRISTNVSVIETEPEANPLPLYLASIARLLDLPQDTLVLPSHGKPFVGLHERIAQLTRHHDERLADVLVACARQAQSAADLLPVLFKRTLDLHQSLFAMGEAVAHLHALAAEGRLRPVAGADGVRRFAAVA